MVRAAEWPSSQSKLAAEPSLQGGAVAAGAVALAAWLVGVLAYLVPAVVAGVFGVVAGLVLGRLTRPHDRVWLAIAFLPAVLLLGSGLVPNEGRYLPALVVSCAIGAAVAPDLLRHPRSPVWPSRVVIASAAAYLAWFAVATVASSQFRGSVEYLIGAVGTLGLVLVVIPTVLATRDGMRALFVALGALGPLLVGFGLALAFVGHLDLFGQTVGRYELLQLTVAGHQTALVVPRITGPYYTPSYDAVALAIATLALLTLEEGATGLRRRLIRAAVVVSIAGLAATFDRNGMLTLAAGAGLLAVIGLVRRRSVGLPAVASLVAGLLFVAVLLNVLGATLAPTQPSGGTGGQGAAAPATGQQGTANPPDEAIDDLQVRGGASLSGRDKLWRASVAAIQARPVFGAGPGTNAEAIAPFLVGEARRYLGLTSHDTWLRTAVELGIPGLGLLLAFILAVAASCWRIVRSTSLDTFGVGLVAIFGALLFAFTFETFLLGGLSFGSVVWPLTAGMMTIVNRRALSTVT